MWNLKSKLKMKFKKFQMGGAAPAPEQGAPQGAPQGGPEEQLAMMAQQIIEQMGPEAAAMLAQIIMEMLQGGAAPSALAQPTFQRKGGKLVLIGRK